MGKGGTGLPAKIRWFVYLSHALSTWGDRMWSFGVGLFMVIISPESLRVTAVYGLSMGCSVLLFGALIGDWIDKTPRLTAARTALIVQNVSVIICAAAVFTVVTLKADIQAAWPDGGLLTLCNAGIILIAILCTLGSMATNIAVQRDWIVEICGRDKDLLATMTATLRRIDLFNSLVAPIVTGQIMYFASVGTGALFIAGWNLVSVFVEYILLWKVYSLVPALKSKKLKYKQNQDVEETAQEMIEINGAERKDHKADENIKNPLNEDKIFSEKNDSSNGNKSEDIESSNGGGNVEKDEKIESSNGGGIVDKDEKIESSNGGGNVDKDEKNEDIVMLQSKTKKPDSVLLKMFSGFIILYRGWRTYMKYDVAFAGLGLACLYMTVLGFDNITVGFAYTQGINESWMGVIMAAGAVMGILGTFIYPIVRRRIGLERTGLFGFFIEISFLCLCVASIWAPGSPFDPLHKHSDLPDTSRPVTHDRNYTVVTNNSIPELGYNMSAPDSSNISTLNNSLHSNRTTSDGINDVNSQPLHHDQSLVSVALLMAGIILARCGLWMADLTITQLFLENVRENERGIVNGVQTSLNKLMDMLKFIMVIAAPQAEVFGILILVSFSFIVIGWILYAKYSYGARGHLFHFDKLRKCNCSDARNNNTNTNMIVTDSGSQVLDGQGYSY